METKQRILIVTDAWEPQTNGVVRTYQALSSALKRRDNIVKVIGPDDFSLTVPTPSYREIKLAVMPYRQMEKYIDTFAPTRIHIATEGPLGWSARKYCMRNNLFFTTCYHTKFPDYIAARVQKTLKKPLYDISVQMIKKFHASSKTILVASKTLEQELKTYGIENKTAPMTRGVDRSIFYVGHKNRFQDLPAPVALYVGRVSTEKNLKAFLSMEWAGTKVVVGDGPQRRALEQQFPEAHFIGKQTGMALGDCYRSADVFVFPSRTDTFGMVLVEALACGLPIAAYNVTGPKDIVINPNLGILDDDLSFAAHAALRHGTADYRHNHVFQTYSWDKACEQFLNVA